MINVTAVRELLQWLEAHPEQHNQGVWAKQVECGTVMCAAGAACALAGAEFDWGHDTPEYVVSDSLPEHARNEDRVRTYIPYAARRLLGLSEEEASHLFHACRNMEHIKEFLLPMVEAAERGV